MARTRVLRAEQHGSLRRSSNGDCDRPECSTVEIVAKDGAMSLVVDLASPVVPPAFKFGEAVAPLESLQSREYTVMVMSEPTAGLVFW